MNKRLVIVVAMLCGSAVLSGCFARRATNVNLPTLAEVGPVLDNYGEAIVPVGGTIVVQGDDTVYGTAAHGRRGLNGSSVPRTGTSITETMRRVLHHVTIVNRGYPGDSIVKSAQRWADQPAGNLIILSYGFGDHRNKTLGAVYETALRKMVRQAHAQGAAVFILLTPPVTDVALGPDLTYYRNVDRQVAAEENAEVFDPLTTLVQNHVFAVKSEAQTPQIYQLMAGSMIPYIKVAGSLKH